MGFDKGLVSTKIDVWLNGQAFDPVFKWYLNDLIIHQIQPHTRLHLV